MEKQQLKEKLLQLNVYKDNEYLDLYSEEERKSMLSNLPLNKKDKNYGNKR